MALGLTGETSSPLVGTISAHGLHFSFSPRGLLLVSVFLCSCLTEEEERKREGTKWMRERDHRTDGKRQSCGQKKPI